MSSIRNGQESEYVKLHNGSRAYIYDSGSEIVGIGSYSDFVDALCTHAENAGLPGRTVQEFEQELEEFYQTKRGDANAIGEKPEMAHIIAQHMDIRLDEFTLAPQFRTLLQEYAESDYTDCPECGDQWRPDPYTSDTQGDLCHDCNDERLATMDVTADVSDLIEYVEDMPDEVTEEHDDEFYALVTETYMAAEGDTRLALNAQLGEVADEVMDAHIEQRPARKDEMLSILERING